MLTLSKQNSIIFASLLSLAMWATRGQHVATLTHLPDASWAIFFLLGIYFRNRLLLPLFLAQAALADFLAVTQFGVSNYCLTPAYPFLIPAYSALWFAGRWFAMHNRTSLQGLAQLLFATAVGTAMCELISSGSFYFLGGRFEGTSLSGFSQMLVQYFPSDLGNVMLYVGAAAAIHMLASSLHRPAATT